MYGEDVEFLVFRLWNWILKAGRILMWIVYEGFLRAILVLCICIRKQDMFRRGACIGDARLKDVLSVMDNRSGLFCGLWEGLTGEFVVSGFLNACCAGWKSGGSL